MPGAVLTPKATTRPATYAQSTGVKYVRWYSTASAGRVCKETTRGKDRRSSRELD
jgi:hypothetical protein